MGRAEEATGEALRLMADALRIMNSNAEHDRRAVAEGLAFLREVRDTIVTISRQNGEMTQQMQVMVERQQTYDRKQADSAGKIAILRRDVDRLQQDTAALKQSAGR